MQAENRTRSGIEPDREIARDVGQEECARLSRGDRVGTPRARRLLESKLEPAELSVSPAGPHSSLPSPASTFAQAWAEARVICGTRRPEAPSPQPPNTVPWGGFGAHRNGTVGGQTPHSDLSPAMIRKRADRENRRSTEFCVRRNRTEDGYESEATEPVSYSTRWLRTAYTVSSALVRRFIFSRTRAR